MEGELPNLNRFPEARRVFRRCLNTVGMEAHPFHVGWYNDLVAPIYRLDFHPDTIGFAVINGPDTFERATLRWCKEKYAEDPDFVSENPLDESMAYILNKTEMELTDQGLDPTIIKDFDVDESSPLRRPKVLVQTAAHCAGAVEYFHIDGLDKAHITDDNWISDAKLLGVAIHPEYGGWFGIRAVIVCKTLVKSDLFRMCKPPRPIVVHDQRVIWKLLEEFCSNWQSNTWRDILPHNDGRKYSMAFQAYLATDRFGFERWEYLKANGLLFTGPNDYDVSGDTYDD